MGMLVGRAGLSNALPCVVVVDCWRALHSWLHGPEVLGICADALVGMTGPPVLTGWREDSTMALDSTSVIAGE